MAGGEAEGGQATGRAVTLSTSGRGEIPGLVTGGKEADGRVEAGDGKEDGAVWQRRRLRPGGAELVGSSGTLAGSVGGADGIRELCRGAGMTEPEFRVTLGYVFLNVVLSQFEAQSEAVSFPLDQPITSTSDHPPIKFSHFRATRHPIPVPRHSGLGSTQLGTALCPEPRNSSQVCVNMHHGQESAEGLPALPGHSPCVGLAQGSSREAQRSCHCESPLAAWGRPQPLHPRRARPRARGTITLACTIQRQS